METSELKLYDKVFYEGESKQYRFILFTVMSIEDAPSGRVYLLQSSDDDLIVSFYTNREDLLTVSYNGAPKYQFNDIVYHFFDRDYVRGIVTKVNVSLNNKPNSYEVMFDTGIQLSLQETQLFQFNPENLLDSTITTKNHVNKVRENLNRIINELLKRGELHDASKYENPEKVLLDAIEYKNVNEGYAPYGSPAYIENTKILKPMLRHHYALNSHHPEHYTNGVYGMSLMDVVEMLCDWQAASVRNKEAVVNITLACQRYCINDQLKRIFMNTADLMGWKYV